MFTSFLAPALASAASGLPQEVYVWQHAWTPPVGRAVNDNTARFDRIIVLAAEVSWQDGKPRVIQVPVDYPVLSRAGRPAGLALRIGPYPGSFKGADSPVTFLADLGFSLVEEARHAGLSPVELQLDYDCASSKLDGYLQLIGAMRTRIAPLPLVITVLPSWMDEAAFKPLIEAADGYVLQVHSLEKPISFDHEFTLCDPAAARRAAARASALGVPFRVALPTYGYEIAFDAKGRFIGLSADGPAKSWPADARVKEVRADPIEMSALVREWSSKPLAGMQGILWYRLPVQGDKLNWRWPTLSATMAGRTPRKSVRVNSHRVEPGLVEINLVNDGELDISSRLAIQTRWRGARLVAGDALNGFELADRDVSSARFEAGARGCQLAAGEQQVVGWLRLSEDREVELEIEKSDAR